MAHTRAPDNDTLLHTAGTPEQHEVTGHSLLPPWPEGFEVAMFAMGCFWGAERLFWQKNGVWVTMVGYCGGEDPAPTYERVCQGQTGHAEAVRVVYDPQTITYAQLLQCFWENHDPTQGMRQGHDKGTQYRSVVFTHCDEQQQLAEQTRQGFQEQLLAKNLGRITTQIVPAGPFHYAEPYHQQYLAKNPQGYCSLRGTGASCAI
jgi:peptide-methionine (S)-S-oxide reductase